MSFKQFLNEGKSDYVIYHNSYTSAIQEAEAFAEKNGYELDPEEMADKVGLGPKKPSEGKTNRFSITLYKNGREQKKMLQIQVYNRGTDKNTYELNAYIS